LLPARDIGGVDRGPTSFSSNRFAIDSPLEGVVSSEPVSASLFPANRVKYRELRRLEPDQAFALLEKASILKVLKKQFPEGANRESVAPYQGIESKFAAGSGNCGSTPGGPCR
jgi:hypothetical protein